MFDRCLLYIQHFHLFDSPIEKYNTVYHAHSSRAIHKYFSVGRHKHGLSQQQQQQQRAKIKNEKKRKKK